MQLARRLIERCYLVTSQHQLRHILQRNHTGWWWFKTGLINTVKSVEIRRLSELPDIARIWNLGEILPSEGKKNPRGKGRFSAGPKEGKKTLILLGNLLFNLILLVVAFENVLHTLQPLPYIIMPIQLLIWWCEFKVHLRLQSFCFVCYMFQNINLTPL